MYTIKETFGHLEVYKDGLFLCSADSWREAEEDIKKDQEDKVEIKTS